MKSSGMKMFFLAFFAVAAHAAAVMLQSRSAVVAAAQKDRTITNVVKMLQEMLEKSKDEGDSEYTLYKKFACFCDGEEAAKTAAIKESTKDIALLEANIEKTKGNSGELSSDLADLKAKLAENAAARLAATNLRSGELLTYTNTKADLETAVGQMDSAMVKLTEVGADQTASSGADNSKFMAGYKGSLLSLGSEVQHALVAAQAFMTPKQRKATSSFLQAPFTGTYTSQSTGVMGILKNMRDTFDSNLAEASRAEEAAVSEHTKLMVVLNKTNLEMQGSFDAQDQALGSNDGTLSANVEQLRLAVLKKSGDESDKAVVEVLHAKKTKAFENRKLLRANEEAAIAQCVSILNSDAAFDLFGNVGATSTGATAPSVPATSLIQLSSVRRHVSHAPVLAGPLGNGGKPTKKLAANPFDPLLDEVDLMIKELAKEGTTDAAKKLQCEDSREKSNTLRDEKKATITGLNAEINGLELVISGLNSDITGESDDLAENKEAQATTTIARTAENTLYQKNIKHLVHAEAVLGKAIKILKTYYDNLEQKIEAGEALLQTEHHAKQPTAEHHAYADKQTWDGNSYVGQKQEGDGAVGMLEFISSETAKEQTEAHAEEQQSQHTFEDDMTTAKATEKASLTSLNTLTTTLTEKKKDLLRAKEDLKKTQGELTAVQNFLAEIAAGCDFIVQNFVKREEHRATEATNLLVAKNKIKTSPAYTTQEEQAKNVGYGKCYDKCVGDDGSLACKACQAGVSEPGYCAGHPEQSGC